MDQTQTVILIILWAAAAILARYLLSVYNKLVRLQKSIDKTWSEIDMLLKEKSDEAARLVEVLEEYVVHEDLLARITQARESYQKAVSMHEKVQAEKELSDAMQSLFSAAGNYPELEQSKEFLQLWSMIDEIDNRIVERKDLYNEAVNTFNVKIQQMPGSFVAMLARYRREEVFEEKKNLKVADFKNDV